MYTEASKRATMKYKKENLKRIALEVTKEQYKDIEEYANGRPIATVLKEIIFNHINS